MGGGGGDLICDITSSSTMGGGIFVTGCWVDGWSGAMDVASELMLVPCSEPESSGGMVTVRVDWLTVLEGALSGVPVPVSCISTLRDSFFDFTRLMGDALFVELRSWVSGLEGRVFTLLVDLESLSSFFSSSTIVSTVTGLAADGLGRPAV